MTATLETSRTDSIPDWLCCLLVLLSAAGLCGCALPEPGTSVTEARRTSPNFIFILADDMGYGDPQCYNPSSTIPTPHLNRLAREGMMFTDAHSGSAVCTPTRYGVLTGRYAWRSRLKRGVLFPPNDPPLIEPKRLTVAGLLKEHGYHTACIGKWHLGIEWARDTQDEVDFNQPFSHGPTDVGFDQFFGIAASLDMVPYGFFRDHAPVQAFTETQPAQRFPYFVRQGPRAPDFHPDQALDRLTQEAATYIQERATQPAPFFLYLALTSPHKPTWPAERFRGKTGLGPYADFVHQTDWTVGQVLRALDDTGLADQTLLIFTSDNGSYMYRRNDDQPDHVADHSNQGYAPHHHRANAHWRGTKADVWEAGHRVPFIVRWPEHVAPETQCSTTICLTDFMATCAELVSHQLPDAAAEDSFSLVPLLSGHPSQFDRAPVVNHSANGMFALRSGPWKMVFGNGSGGRERPAGKPFEKPYTLFNLSTDPSEANNLIEQHPDVAERLAQHLEALRNNPSSRSLRR
jgi:arylsulfatase A-like enzyme